MMEGNGWLPLGLRGTRGADSDYSVLVDGVPDWLEPSLFRWVADQAAIGGGGLAYRAEQLLRIRLPDLSGREARLVAYWRVANPADRLTLIDLILHEWELLYEVATQSYGGEDTRREVTTAVTLLDRILTDGGSLWRFETDPHWCLVRRVSEAAEQQYQQSTSNASDAADRLKTAWTACYRQNPNYDEAYRNAILAVEAVVLPETIPKDTVGTLGKAIRHMRDTASRWSIGGLGTDALSSGEVLLSMLELLWTNQQRHAKGDGTISSVCREEAEAAVGVAVTLVQWFSAGIVTKA